MQKTFVIQIKDAQHSTWQGVITWTEGNKSQSFRSALELIKLIDSALEEKGAQDQLTVSA